MNHKKVALVFDWMDDRGGMEIVNNSLVKCFPDAEIFTTIFSEEKFPKLKTKKIHTSFLQWIPKAFRPKHQLLAPFMPFAFWQFDLSSFDLIISSCSSGFSKVVYKKPFWKNIPRKKQTHICYCHSPVRYLYHAKEDYIKNYPLPYWLKLFSFCLKPIFWVLRKIDFSAAKRVDYFVSNSNFIGERIKKYYHKESKTIYPGVPFSSYPTPKVVPEKKEYFLALGRFIPYKNFELIVRTFAKNKLPIKLAGTGPELEKCKVLAKELGAKNIEFLGFVNQKKFPEIFQKARAFIFPAEEDFGISMVESLYYGVPILYYQKGGALEIVEKNKAGIGFAQQTVESLQGAIHSFIASETEWAAKSKTLQIATTGFSEKVFIQEIKQFVAANS